jgi:hypothetical protein
VYPKVVMVAPMAGATGGGETIIVDCGIVIVAVAEGIVTI